MIAVDLRVRVDRAWLIFVSNTQLKTSRVVEESKGSIDTLKEKMDSSQVIQSDIATNVGDVTSQLKDLRQHLEQFVPASHMTCGR